MTSNTKNVKYIPINPSTTFADNNDSTIADKNESGNIIAKSFPDTSAKTENTKEYITR